MRDQRLDRLAEVIVGYSTKVALGISSGSVRIRSRCR